MISNDAIITKLFYKLIINFLRGNGEIAIYKYYNLKKYNMPFVRISLRKGLGNEIRNVISEAIHKSLIQEFLIPENDYFHVIEELEASLIKYPQEYLDISHTENIVFIQIVAGSGRTEEQKKKLYAEIGRRISSKTEILINDIIIILIENGTYINWSFGMGEIQKTTHI